MKKLKLHPAAQSMTALGLSLILLIGIGEVLGRLVFPAGSESDRYAALIARHGSLLEQVAEDVTDDTQWPGIMGLPEVQEALKEGGITGFETRDDGVAFRLEATEIGEQWILY
ncbi:MAG: hypothetical protein U0L09_09615, partial [Christensenellales bacterium]|nr:hypothetical protein [Christensenellales bacterium]